MLFKIQGGRVKQITVALVTGIFLIQCNRPVYKSASSVSSAYPSATKQATVLYATKVTGREGKMNNLAAHYVITGSGSLSWQKKIKEAGDYDVVLAYSVRKEGASVTIGSGKDSVTGPIAPTHGVYTERKEWYQFNAERKQLTRALHLDKDVDSIKLTVNAPSSDFETIVYSVELIPLEKKENVLKEITEARKARPNMDWFASMKYGVMFHWTSQAAPQSGAIKPYKEAVKSFDVNAFVDMVTKTGADYVIFTGNHAEPHFPAPLKAWEKEYPGWTTDRDLITEISEALDKKNIRFILYLATHIYGKQDKVKTEEFERLNDQLLSEIGERYKNKIDGYWLDGWYQGYSTHPNFNFEKLYKVSKKGNPARLLALNSWLYPIVTEWQDYWAGEVYTPGAIPNTKIIETGPGKGLQFQSLVVLQSDWVHDKIDTKIPAPRLETNNLINYISSCSGKGPVTINLGIYQDGTIDEEALAVMQQIKQRLK